MASRIIKSEDLTPSQVAEALGQLPEGIRSKVSGVVKTAAPIREDQSPEAIRKANLKTLKAKRRDLISELINLEKEIFEMEEINALDSISPEARRKKILVALRGSEDILGRRSFSLSEARDLFPIEDITFASWITELTALSQEGVLSFIDDRIVLFKNKDQIETISERPEK